MKLRVKGKILDRQINVTFQYESIYLIIINFFLAYNKTLKSQLLLILLPLQCVYNRNKTKQNPKKKNRKTATRLKPKKQKKQRNIHLNLQGISYLL